MTDTLTIAYECGAITGVKSSLNTSLDSVYFLPEELESFRKRIEDEMKERCAELFEDQYTDSCPGTNISEAIRKME